MPGVSQGAAARSDPVQRTAGGFAFDLGPVRRRLLVDDPDQGVGPRARRRRALRATTSRRAAVRAPRSRRARRARRGGPTTRSAPNARPRSRASSPRAASRSWVTALPVAAEQVFCGGIEASGRAVRGHPAPRRGGPDGQCPSPCAPEPGRDRIPPLPFDGGVGEGAPAVGAEHLTAGVQGRAGPACDTGRLPPGRSAPSRPARGRRGRPRAAGVRGGAAPAESSPCSPRSYRNGTPTAGQLRRRTRSVNRGPPPWPCRSPWRPAAAPSTPNASSPNPGRSPERGRRCPRARCRRGAGTSGR